MIALRQSAKETAHAVIARGAAARKISRSKVGEDNGIDLAAKRKEKGSCNLI